MGKMTLGRGSFNKGKKKRVQPDRVVYIVGGTSTLVFLLILVAFLHFSSKPSEAVVAKPKIQDQPVVTEVLIPIDTVKVGVSLQPAMFRRELRREEQVTGDMIRSYDELKGLYAKGSLIRGQPILKGALTNRQPVHVLTALLPRGYRAVALQVEKPLLDNVDGWAQPGTDVDVVWITNVFGKEMAAILAGPVRVLASNKATEGIPAREATKSNYVTVTLLLSVRDAVRVNLAQMYGKISLGLRGLGDRRPVEGSQPVSSIMEEPPVSARIKPVLSVKVHDQDSKKSELRQYDPSGRRLTK